MTNYAYLINLFSSILSNSKAIEGRFYVGSRYGLQEINYDELGQVLGSITSTKKYPLVLMAPPHSNLSLDRHDENWESFRIIMFFMKTTYYNSDNKISSVNYKTLTSQHTIPQDWHDMKRCAINFIRALVNLQNSLKPPRFIFPTNQTDNLFIPVSNVGLDRASGVRVAFNFKLFTGCDIEDYDEYPKTLSISLDEHLEHAL